MDGSKPLLDECVNIGKWLTILHPQYINCYSFTLHPKFSNITITIELFIYLAEEVAAAQCIDCFLSNVKTQLSGAVLVVHNAASYPDINQESINLQPGTLTEVKLKTIQNKMKTPPYGRCYKFTPEHLQINNEDYAYTEMACKFVTLQRKINEECKCIAIEYPFIDNSSLPFCTSLPHFISHKSCPEFDIKNTRNLSEKACLDEINLAIEKSGCKNNITRQYHGDGIKGCHLPCLFYSYETDRSISTWPTKSYHLNWIQSSVAKSLMSKPEINTYKKAIQKLSEGNEAEAYEILTNQNMLEKKLVGVVINKPNYNLHVVEEKEVLSLTSFLSQSGGLFSIWIGLTLINIVEIIEMLIRLSEIKENEEPKEAEIYDNPDIKNSIWPSDKYIMNVPSNQDDLVLDSFTNNPSSRMMNL